MDQKKKSIAILVPEELHSKLKSLAAENGRTMSGYIRQILKRYIRHLEQNSASVDDWWRVPKW